MLARIRGQPRISVHTSLIEPIVFLQETQGWVDSSISPSTAKLRAPAQIRGIVAVTSKGGREKSQIYSLDVTLKGTSKIVSWKYGSPEERIETFYMQTEQISVDPSTEASGSNVHAVPFSLAIPSDLPPTVDVEFGCIDYAIIVSMKTDSGGGVATQAEPVKVRLVYDPILSATTNARSQSVQQQWIDRLRYSLSTSSGVATIAGCLDLQLDIEHVAEGVCLHSLNVALTEHISFLTSASAPKQDIRRSWNLVERSLLDCWPSATHDDASASQEMTLMDDKRGILEACQQSAELWSLPLTLRLPSCEATRLTPTIMHPKSHVRVTHALLVQMHVSQRSDAKRTVLETQLPLILRSIYFSEPYSQLPCYWCAINVKHPYERDPLENKSNNAGQRADHKPTTESIDSRERLASQWLTLTSEIQGASTRCTPSLPPPPSFSS